MRFTYRRNSTTNAFICTAVILLLNVPAVARQENINWNQFRGPNGQGLAQQDAIPLEFGPASNVLWRTPVPQGHSSPVIWNNRIFITAGSRQNQEELLTLAIDRQNGRILWTKTIHANTKLSFHPLNNPASSTPAADDKHIYVYFGTYGIICYDHAGNHIWQREIETPKSKYGMATSPILYRDKLIIVLDGDDGSSQLLALNRQTGQTAWRKPRPLFKAGWSTPIIWRHEQTDELVVLGSKRLTAYNPENGEEIWWLGGFSQETVGIPVTGNGLLFAGAAALGGRGDDNFDAAATWKTTLQRFDRNQDNRIQRSEMTKGFALIQRPELEKDNPGYGLPIADMDVLLGIFDRDKNKIITENEWMLTTAAFTENSRPTLVAIRPGAEDDARKSHLEWEVGSGIPETSSLLHTHGKLYLIRDGGLLTCLHAETGRQIFKDRIGATGQYIASPVAADDKIILASTKGVVTVIQVDDNLKILAANDLKEKIFATPAVAAGTIYLRTADNLYAFTDR
ncbi:MAG: PQQ-binding-like beta-propeller repeat protein [Sedimentisphaerales bacterium]|nr:PQQ-binding-like beta-propeller repeat protein [Sedimentisphaerales bacterium]